MSSSQLSEGTKNRIYELAGGRRSKKRGSSPSSPIPVANLPPVSLPTPPSNKGGNMTALPPPGMEKQNSSTVAGGDGEGYPLPNTLTLDDLGGLDVEKPLLEELLMFPLARPDLYAKLGADPTCGILLHGVPGCGKTTLATAIAGTLKVPMFKICAAEIISGLSGDSESQLRALFSNAVDSAPSILFIDEIDAIAGRRDEAQKDMSRRIVSQLLACMDGLTQAWREQRKVVIVLGATSRLESIDPALRRAGRFDREIGLAIPTQKNREDILRVLCRRLTISQDMNFAELAQKTPGFVCADLHSLTKEGTALAIRRIQNSPDASELSITMDDMRGAIKRVQPSAMREGFTVVPNVSWEDVGALDDVREKLIMCIVRPICRPDDYRKLGVTQSMGVLLYGPPGCGKTLVAKAVAREAGANFISVKGPELLNKFVGESERSIRALFNRARSSAPCVLFFDELDALAPRRGADHSNSSSERVVNQLLTEMDGMDSRDVLGVYVIGATNRPDMIDPALRRPGRLDNCLLVPIPNEKQRYDILKALARKVPLDPGVNLQAIAYDKRCEGFSGADLAALLREAALLALKKSYDGQVVVQQLTEEFLDEALNHMKPSVSLKDAKSYELYQQE